METAFLQHRDTPDDLFSGNLGAPMPGKEGSAKYWSTSLDQLEDADSDPRLISEKVGLEYNPNKDYTLVIVDTEKAKPLTNVKSVPATFERVSEFANTELPDDFPKEFTDKVMTPDFQAEYAKYYRDALDQEYLENEWSTDTDSFKLYLETNDINKEQKLLLLDRMRMQKIIGNNQDYLGNGLTKDNNQASSNSFGAVETFNFERKAINFNQLNEAKAITIMKDLSTI